MKVVIDVPNSLYANLKKIANGSNACKRLLECVKAGEPVGNTDNAPTVERPQGNLVYLCDGDNCPAEKASCKHGGPCRHTTNIEHAINFRRFHDTDKFFEVENVMRIDGQENQ